MKHKNERTQTEACIRIDDDRCSRCMICLSVCPFDALSTEEKLAKVNLDVEKCQVCGICSAACPASAIETIYYGDDPFLNHVSTVMHEKGLNKLVLACRGSGIPENGILVSSGEQHTDNSIEVSLPCLGRVPPELLLKVLSIGVEKIVILPCEDKYCRFKDGSVIGTRRFLLVQALLNQFGFKPDTLTAIKRSIKAHIDAYRCIGCGNCIYTCAYKAIKMEVPGVAQVDPEACAGCGACEAVCPVFAVKLDRFDHEAISNEIRSFGSFIPKMKLQIEKPVILVLSCEWSEFPDWGSNQSRRIGNVAFLELPCAGSVDTLHILEAFHSGFDGVLIAACKKGECKLEKGNEKAEKRISSLKKLLAEIDLEDRLEICFVSPKNVGDLETHVKLFEERISPSAEKESVNK
jgi:coenzyme F420-reducing hydrogenase delta subunit/ferredoxin